MQEFILVHYLWFKAAHIIAVIAWMAGLLYLPRLFVYHAGASAGSEASQTFKLMERRLYTYIMTPAMLGAWGIGVLMLWANPVLLSGQGWMHVKLTMLVLMTGVHHMMKAWMKKFSADTNRKSPRFFKIVNEVPTLLMLVIVVMAVVKPF